MKILSILAIAIFLSSITISAQEITGQWNGLLKVQHIQLRLVFHVTKTENGYSATMDSPDQGANGILVNKTSYDPPKIKFEISNLRIEYSGEVVNDEIVGVFIQAGQKFAMNLSKKLVEKEVVKKPQEPTKPYTYYTDDVVFPNKKAGISLAGTLTLPSKEGNFPAVILISGSGPQNRDEELLGHKPFLIISDHLTKQGIAVLRFDDRGVGQSTGVFETATSADLATDVVSAIDYLKTRKEVARKKIGLIGHSEGGIIAPMVAAKSRDINFIVLLAGTGIQGDSLLILQQQLIARASGVSEEEIENTTRTNKKIFAMVVASQDDKKLKSDLAIQIRKTLDNDTTAEYDSLSKEEMVKMLVKQVSSPWMQYFLKYNPVQSLKNVKCPVLAINGEKDLQVPPHENLTAISNALKKGRNKNVTTKVFPNLNHLFQECKTGVPAEYATIEQTFSPSVLHYITEWIRNQTK